MPARSKSAAATLQTKLEKAVANNNIGDVDDCLEAGANANGPMKKYGGSLLYHAAYFTSTDLSILKSLLRHGADPNIKTGEKMTALECLFDDSEDYLDLNKIRLLAKHGAKIAANSQMLRSSEFFEYPRIVGLFLKHTVIKGITMKMKISMLELLARRARTKLLAAADGMDGDVDRLRGDIRDRSLSMKAARKGIDASLCTLWSEDEIDYFMCCPDCIISKNKACAQCKERRTDEMKDLKQSYISLAREVEAYFEDRSESDSESQPEKITEPEAEGSPAKKRRKN